MLDIGIKNYNVAVRTSSDDALSHHANRLVDQVRLARLDDKHDKGVNVHTKLGGTAHLLRVNTEYLCNRRTHEPHEF